MLAKYVKKIKEFGGLFTFISCRCIVTWSYSRQPSNEDKLPEVSNCTTALLAIAVLTVVDTALANF